MGKPIGMNGFLGYRDLDDKSPGQKVIYVMKAVLFFSTCKWKLLQENLQLLAPVIEDSIEKTFNVSMDWSGLFSLAVILANVFVCFT